MSELGVWLMMAAMVAVTFLTRFSMLELFARVRIPMLLMRALRFVPAALLTAIAVPGLVYKAGALDLTPGNEQLLAGIAAALVAWRTRNVVWTIVCGMAVVWVMGLLTS